MDNPPFIPMEADRMAAFTRADPSDPAAFDARYRRVRSDPTVTMRAVDDGASPSRDRRRPA